MLRRIAPTIAVWACAAVAAVGTLCAGPVQAQLSVADKQTLAELALQWAVDGGIPDVKLLKDPSKLVVLSTNLPPRTELHVPNRTVSLQSPISIQARADMRGDFLYFRFGPIARAQDHATVPIALVWAVGVRSKTAYLSGGGATLHFEQRDGKWTLRPVQERWAS
jgi:hypothetical protein